jgi:hypothetical protein
MVKKKEIPLDHYTYLGLHPEANLTDKRVKLKSWGEFIFL